MKKNRVMREIIYKELYRLFGNKKVYFLSCIAPLLFILLFSFGMQKASSMGQDYTIWVYCDNEELTEKIQEVISQYQYVEFIGHTYEEKDIKDGKATVAISIGEKISVIYDANLVLSTKAIYQAEMIADELSMQLVNTKLLEQYKAARVTIKEQNVATDSELTERSFSLFFPTMYMFLLGLVNMFIVSLAIDMISGERERGIFDAVILSGVSESKILVGKGIAIICEAIPIYLIGFFSTIAGCYIFESSMGESLMEHFLQKESLITLFLFSISLAVFSSSLFLMISARFGKIKHARSYSGIGILMFSLLCLLNNLWKSERLAYVPIINVVSTMTDMLNEKLNFKAVLCSSALAVGMSCLFFFIANVHMKRRTDD